MMRTLIAIISVFFFLISTNYVFGQNDEEVNELDRFLGILYIVLLIGVVIAISYGERIYFRRREKIRHSKNHGTYTADGKKVTGTLPKGYSDGGRSRSENEVSHSRGGKKKLWKYELAMVAIGIFTLLGFILGLVADPVYVEGNSSFFILIWFYSSFAGIPLFIYVNKKSKTLEQEQPSGLTKLYYLGRAKKQCTICQKHPVSKKYHLKNDHKMKDVNVDDYFRDCGCDICAHYDSGG